MGYDSKEDTLKHIKRVGDLIKLCISQLYSRAERHDKSKLESPEKEVFDRETPKLKDLTYGSDEYKKSLERLGVGLKHHYENNRHHPEHFTRGITNMDLFDVLEMVVDWKAASERHKDGDVIKSVDINKKRFFIQDQLVEIIKNTLYTLKALDDFKS